MRLKPITLKLSNNFPTVLCLAFSLGITAQEPVVKDTLVVDEKNHLSLPEVTRGRDSIPKGARFKIDGIAAVVGDYVVLDSDIDMMYIELEAQEVPTGEITRCQLLGRLMEDKLYAHQAEQDSIEVDMSTIISQTEQQLDYVLSQLGSEEKVLQLYKRNSMDELKKEVLETNKNNQLASAMQQKIIEDIEITPEEVRQFFYNIPEGERPVFGAEIEVAQIVIEPEITEESRQNVIARLDEMRRDVVENGVSFATKAVLYSQDPGSAGRGGQLSLNRRSPFAREFKNTVFSLQEGEVSEPFETEFGFHIVQIDRIRGRDVDVRHVLLLPEIKQETINEAKEKIDNLRAKITAGDISFAEAARAESDEVETRTNGGQLVNPLTGDTRFELSKMEPELSARLYDLKEGELTPVFADTDRTGRKRYKIMTVTRRIEEHMADYAQDYEKIRDLALREKQIKAIEKWQAKTIKDTYVNVGQDYHPCEFSSNWLKL